MKTLHWYLKCDLCKKKLTLYKPDCILMRYADVMVKNRNESLISGMRINYTSKTGWDMVFFTLIEWLSEYLLQVNVDKPAQYKIHAFFFSPSAVIIL